MGGRWWQHCQGSASQSASCGVRVGRQGSHMDGGRAGPAMSTSQLLPGSEVLAHALGDRNSLPLGATPGPTPASKADLPAPAQANLPGALVPAARRTRSHCGPARPTPTVMEAAARPPGPCWAGGLCGAAGPPAEPGHSATINKKEQERPSGRAQPGTVPGPAGSRGRWACLKQTSTGQAGLSCGTGPPGGSGRSGRSGRGSPAAPAPAGPGSPGIGS